MSEKTGIQWTDATWNPTTGCTKISPGCANCYIERTPAFRIHGRKFVKGATDLRLHTDRLEQPLHWRKPRRVFVNSLSDLFHPDVPDAFIDRVFAVMALCPQHTFQVLTKRPERMRAYFESFNAAGAVARGFNASAFADELAHDRFDADRFRQIPKGLPNVWLGVSVENQHFADERIPLLLQTPAAVRFISAEPLLGPVDVSGYGRSASTHHVSADVEGMLRNRSFEWVTGDDGKPLTRREAEDALYALHARGVKRIKSTDACVGFSDQTGCPGHAEPRLDWVIVGGESGPGSRPFDLAWARAIVAQCQAAGVACFVKQLGARPQVNGADIRLIFRDHKGGDPAEWPADLCVRQFPAEVAHA